jgi:hypothetical protein
MALPPRSSDGRDIVRKFTAGNVEADGRSAAVNWWSEYRVKGSHRGLLLLRSAPNVDGNI